MLKQHHRELTGPAGRATEVVLEFEPQIDTPSFQGHVASWFLVCPGQSPAWDCYSLQVCHLREIEEAEPPEKFFTDATHQFALVALNRMSVDPQWDEPETWLPLVPWNVCHQVCLPSDAAARELAELAVKAVLEGKLWAEPLLSGMTEPWASTLDASAAHLRGEH